MKFKIKPSMKVKRRYILLAGSKGEVEKTVLDYIGILGWAKAGCVFVEWKNKGEVVLAVDRKEIDNVRAGIEVSDSSIRILRVSGTLKGLEK